LQCPAAAAAALLAGAAICYLARNILPALGPSDLLAIACLPAFMAAAAGNTFFGLLVHPAIRCLGAVSFSLYLLHGIVFMFVGHELKRANLNHLSPLEFWLIFTAIGMILISLCTATYRWIEFPFLSASHRPRDTAQPAEPSARGKY
jgi:peptidoglycan/LPS O-acetylase OafA/YrhL